MRFIHAADLHIDSPLRGLDRYEGAPVERIRSATRQAFIALVDQALERSVDLVLLAGDVFDGDWPDLNTGLFFSGQLARLDREGIRVFIVHGNHDAQSVVTRRFPLPKNTTEFSSEAAQTVQIDALGVAIHGRSFPNRAVDEDLVPEYPAPVPGMFNIGMLHTSLNGRAGHDTYAPTTLEVLKRKGYDYWALGHVHAREVLSDAPRIIYPGNVQGRHANETGPKGCEVVTVTGTNVQGEFVALDVVRWHHLRVSIEGVEDLESVAQLMRNAFSTVVSEAPEHLHAVRVTLTGVCPVYEVEARTPGRLAATIQSEALAVGQAQVWVEQVRVELLAPVDRQAVALRDDAVGELVRLVDSMSAEPAVLRKWVDEYLQALRIALPGSVGIDSLPDADDHEALRVLLLEAEATVLANLASGADTQ